jgi:hypothetical protein
MPQFPIIQTDKSFLVLFFKKEPLPCRGARKQESGSFLKKRTKKLLPI